MRAREFYTIKEFVAPSSNTEQDKKDIFILLGFQPSAEALSKVQNILSNVPSSRFVNPKQTNPKIEPIKPKKPNRPQEPKQQLNQEPIEQPEDNELKEDSSLINALVEKIKQLDPKNPKDAAKLDKIEAILEEDVIEPAITNIVSKKFNSYVEVIISDIKNAIISASNPVIEKIKFLTKCNKGLINLQRHFKKSPNDNIYKLVNDPVFENIKKRLGQIEYGTGSSKIGRMEALLAFIGDGASKQGQGDLIFDDGSELEIKASSLDKKGGTTGGVLVALGKDKNTGEAAYGSNTTAGKIWREKMSKILPNVPMSLNEKSITVQINPYIANNAKNIKYTVKAIKEIYSSIFIKADSDMLAPLDKIGTKEGIDATVLIKAARQIEFDYYQNLMKHSAVLFINSSTGNYTYVETGKDLVTTLTSGKKNSKFYTSGILDMQGTYGNGLGKIFHS